MEVVVFPVEGEDHIAGFAGRRIAYEEVAVVEDETLGVRPRDRPVVPAVGLQVAAVLTQLPFQLLAFLQIGGQFDFVFRFLVSQQLTINLLVWPRRPNDCGHQSQFNPNLIPI